jgi:hypothetical protein
MSGLLSNNFVGVCFRFSEVDKVFNINYLKKSMSVVENLGIGCGGL